MSLTMLNWATRMSTHQLIRRWVARNRQIYSPGTCTLYSRVIWRLVDFIPENIKNTTVEHLERYVAHCLDKEKLSRRTVCNHIGIIKSFFRWASENYDIENLASKIKLLKYDPPKRRFISPEEYEKVLAVCSDGESRIIKLLYHTGLRASELQGLQLSNIHGKSIRFTGKGRKERTVPLNETAYNCLYIDDKPHIDFLKSFRYRNALYALCARLSKRARLNSVASPHSYRRFFGTQLRAKGVDILTISQLYGHKNLDTTLLYLEHDDLQGSTDCLD